MSWSALPLAVKLIVCEWLPATGSGVWQTERDMWRARDEWMLRHTVHRVFQRVQPDDDHDKLQMFVLERAVERDDLDDQRAGITIELAKLEHVNVYITHATNVLAKCAARLTHASRAVHTTPAPPDPTRYVVDENDNDDRRHDYNQLMSARVRAKADHARAYHTRVDERKRDMRAWQDNIENTRKQIHRAGVEKIQIQTRIESMHDDIRDQYQLLDSYDHTIMTYEMVSRLYSLQKTSHRRKSKQKLASHENFITMETNTVFGVPHGVHTRHDHEGVTTVHARYGRAHHDSIAAVSVEGIAIWARNGHTTRIECAGARVYATTGPIVFDTSVWTAVKNIQYTYTAHPDDQHNSMIAGDTSETAHERYMSLNPASQHWMHGTRDPRAMLPTSIVGATKTWQYNNRAVVRERTNGATAITYRGLLVEEWIDHNDRKMKHEEEFYTRYLPDGTIIHANTYECDVHQCRGVLEWKLNNRADTLDAHAYRYDGEHYTITGEWGAITIARRTLEITHTGNVYAHANRYYAMIMEDGELEARLILDRTQYEIMVHDPITQSIDSVWTTHTTVWGDPKDEYNVGLADDRYRFTLHVEAMRISREDDVVTWRAGGRVCEQYNFTTQTLDTYTHDQVSNIHWSTTRAGVTTHTMCPGKNLYADYVGMHRESAPGTTVHEFTDQLVTYHHATQTYTYSELPAS